jgi:energy-coupling factor transporter ATP-binding protein EcfA2
MPLQNAAIIGPRGSGKTSLLLHLKDIVTASPADLRPGQRSDWLLQPGHYRWVFVDFRNPQFGTQAGLLRYLLTELELSVPTPCNLDRFVEVVSRNLQSPTVILLDELGVALERYDELNDAFWDGLRALACTMMDGNLAFVLSTREVPSRLARRTNRSSDFFSIFAYSARLGPLTEAEALELIGSSPLPLPPDDIDWILSHSRCWPLLVQILCRERLIALEEGETSVAWREEGLRQIAPFQYLLD